MFPFKYPEEENSWSTNTISKGRLRYLSPKSEIISDSILQHSDMRFTRRRKRWREIWFVDSYDRKSAVRSIFYVTEASWKSGSVVVVQCVFVWCYTTKRYSTPGLRQDDDVVDRR